MESIATKIKDENFQPVRQPTHNVVISGADSITAADLRSNKVWEDDEGRLPAGWEPRDHEGLTYYVDHNTTTTSWERPQTIEVLQRARDHRQSFLNSMQELSKGDAKGHEERQKEINGHDLNHIYCAYRWDPEYCNYKHHPATIRPINEPPMLDYETFIEKVLPSDLRLKKLFLNDLERFILCRDAVTESYLLWNYRGWAKDMCNYDGDPDRKPFYEA